MVGGYGRLDEHGEGEDSLKNNIHTFLCDDLKQLPYDFYLSRPVHD